MIIRIFPLMGLFFIRYLSIVICVDLYHRIQSKIKRLDYLLERALFRTEDNFSYYKW